MLVLHEAGYTYSGRSEPAVCRVSLTVEPGERWWWAGASGCGKSTLLRLAAGLTGRHGAGTLSGTVDLAGRDPAEIPPAERAGWVAYVAQEPADTFVAGTVADEVAFGPESLGWCSERIRRVVRESLERVGLAVDDTTDPRTLSGGQQQRLAIAAALAGGARLLLLDEPLARLDVEGAAALLAHLDALSRDGVAVVVAEHRTEPMAPFCSHALLLHEGQAQVFSGPPPAKALAAAGLSRQWPERTPPEPGPVVRELKQVDLAYGGSVVLREVSFALRAGERVAVVGPNGVGKSTLLGALSGRLMGERVSGVQEVRQDADLALFSETVRDELAYGPREARIAEAEVMERVSDVARRLRLDHKLDEAPQALSAGERLRLAVGSALTTRPQVLLLDEPTAGQDGEAVRGLLGALDAAAPETAVVWATHDRALSERCADRVVELSPQRDPSLVQDGGLAEPRPASRGLDPRVRLILLVAVGVSAVVLNRPVSLGVLTAVAGAVFLAQSAVVGWRWRALGLAAATSWAMCLSQGLFYADFPRTPLVAVGPFVIWSEGVDHGFVQSLRLIASAFAGFALALSTPSDRLIRGLGSLRVPWTVALLAATALRFAPQVGREWLQVREARAARGRPIWRRSPLSWLRQELALLRPVVARALRRGRAMAASLDARGFDPDGRRSERNPLRLGLADWGLASVACAGVAGLLGLTALLQLYLAEVLYLPELRSLYGWVRIWL